uniref:Uncharacterized protein n=1 Tax=Steinernema glaseri TaxID=37863 RepID=A0A1I7ZDZ9_9BILA
MLNRPLLHPNSAQTVLNHCIIPEPSTILQPQEKNEIGFIHSTPEVFVLLLEDWLPQGLATFVKKSRFFFYGGLLISSFSTECLMAT